MKRKKVKHLLSVTLCVMVATAWYILCYNDIMSPNQEIYLQVIITCCTNDTDCKIHPIAERSIANNGELKGMFCRKLTKSQAWLCMPNSKDYVHHGKAWLDKAWGTSEVCHTWWNQWCVILQWDTKLSCYTCPPSASLEEGHTLASGFPLGEHCKVNSPENQSQRLMFHCWGALIIQ